MKRFCYLRFFKEMKIAFMFLIIPILFNNCQKDNDLSQTYSGKTNSFREYETSTWKYEVNTTIPFINISNSLFKKLSFDSALISKGLVVNAKTTETVIPYDVTRKTITNPDLIKNAFYINSIGQQYDLENNLMSLENNRAYNYTVVGGAMLWYEDSQQLDMIFNDSIRHTIVAKPLYLGAEWIRESRRYKNSNGISELFRQDCKVIGIENIIVKAGEFSAFKVEVMNNWVDIPSKSVRAYEFYAPDIGLVLEETDGIMSQASIPPFGEATVTTFHQKVRKELVNYYLIE